MEKRVSQASQDSMTAIILAGGKNVRMGGRNKAFLKIGGKSFIEHQIERLQRIFSEVIISTRTPEVYNHLRLPIVTDVIPDKGPLGGIYSGLMEAASFFSFVIACDMPFVDIELIKSLKKETLVGAAGRTPLRNYDVVVPQGERGLEPLHAFYSKNCIEPIREQLDGNALRMTDFLSRVKVRVVTLGGVKHENKLPIHPFTKGGSGIDALINLNTLEEYETAMSNE